MVKFSLVMGTLGRTEELAGFLASLQRQDYRHFELVIVDQNPDDRLRPLVEEYGALFALHWVRSASGLSRARNVGLRHITGDVVAFPDDDCWYPDGLLAQVASRFKAEPALDGLTGRFTDGQGRSEGRWLSRSQQLNRYTVWRGAISFSIFLRRAWVDRVGGFDEALGVGAGTPWGAGEETDYLLRCLQAGARIFYDRDLVLRHPVKTHRFDEAALQRQGRYEAGFGRVIRRSSFPGWYFPWVCLRTATGSLLALCRGRVAQARFKWHSLRSRIAGWRSSPPRASAPKGTLGIGPFAVQSCSAAELMQKLYERIALRQRTTLLFANTNFVVTCAAFAQRLARPDVVIVNDGLGMDLAARLCHGRRFLENLNGTDFIPRLLAGSPMPLKVFLLGARRDVVADAALAVESRCGQRVVGFCSGYEPVEADVCRQIREARPDVVLVAMGNPLQERWIIDHEAELPPALYVGVGALFDFLARRAVRAPRWVQQLRMEWFFRLCREPRRLWKRYTVDAFKFLRICMGARA